MTQQSIPVRLGKECLEIRPVSEEDIDALLHVYQQCEDFLALGPVATASMDMVLKDLEISAQEGGTYCGIYTSDGKMLGVVDYVLKGFEGDPHAAFLSLLMIGSCHRHGGIGKAVFDAVEYEIRKDPTVTVLRSGVQVNNPQAIQFWQKNGFSIVSGPRLMPDQTIVFDLRKDLAAELSDLHYPH